MSAARDAAILAGYRAEGGSVLVQAVPRTAELLRRAGIARPQRHEFYPVRVRRDRFNQLQLV